MSVVELGDLVEDTKSRLFSEEGVRLVSELSPKSVNEVRTAQGRYIARRNQLLVHYRLMLDRGFMDQGGHDLVDSIPTPPEYHGAQEEDQEAGDQGGQDDVDLDIHLQQTVRMPDTTVLNLASNDCR